MKAIKLLIFGVISLFIGSAVFAQSIPNAVNYQSVIRDNSGTELVNTPVTVRFSIGTSNVTSSTYNYQETHTATSNQFGLVNLVIGTGNMTAGSGSFVNIPWGSAPHFLLVEIDFGSGFEQMGNPAAFVTVPYAQISKDVLNKELPATANGNDILTWNGTAWVAQAPGSISETTTILLDNGDGTFTYTNEAGTPVTFDANINDADADVTNEIQDLQLIGNDLSITNNTSATTIDLSIYNELPTSAVTGQVLTWNGTSWVAQNPGSGADNWGTQTVVSDGTLTGDGTTASPLSGFNGDYTNLTNAPTNVSSFTNDAGYLTTEADGSTTNEIQNINVAGNNINISSGTGTTISSNAPTANQVLTWNGTSWVAQNPGSGADNWGTQTVVSDGTLTGDGTTASPLSGFNGDYTNLTNAPTNVSSFTNDAGYLTTEVDGSVTNEIQTVDQFDLNSNLLSLSLTNDGSAPYQVDLTPIADQPVSLTGGAGITVGGTYPNFTITNSATSGDSDWTQGTGSIYNITDNVGIGLTNPTQLLSMNNGNIYMFRDDAADVKLIMEGDATGITWTLGNEDSSNGFFKISNGNNLGGTGTRLTIRDNGNVGIGEENPLFTLHVEENMERRTGYFYNTTVGSNITNNEIMGIYAGAHGTGSSDKIGGYFEAYAGTGTNYGVYGAAGSGTTNWAGYFGQGDVQVSNNLSIGSESFGHTSGASRHLNIASTDTYGGQSYPAIDLVATTTASFASSSQINFHTLNSSSVPVPLAGIETRQYGGLGEGRLNLRTSNGAGLLPRLSIFPEGYTLISTASTATPTMSNALHVYESNANSTGNQGAFINIHNGGQSISGTSALMSGIRFKNTNWAADEMFKGGIFFKTVGTYGVGRMIFSVNGNATNANATIADAALVIHEDGHVGIDRGEANPGLPLHVGNGTGDGIAIGSAEQITDAGGFIVEVNSSFRPTTDGARVLGGASNRWSAVYASNGTINTSDITQKENIKPLEYGLSEILNIETITFNWKDDEFKRSKVGFSAQNLQQIIPEVVVDKEVVVVDEETGAQEEVETDVLGVYYSDMIPVTVKAIQEQQEIIIQLKAELEALKKEVEELKKGE